MNVKTFALMMLVILVVSLPGMFVPGGVMTEGLHFIFVSAGLGIGAAVELMRKRGHAGLHKEGKPFGEQFVAWALWGLVGQIAAMLTERNTDFIQYMQTRGTSPQNTLIGVATVSGIIGFGMAAVAFKFFKKTA
jgi:hypothetical protein